MEPESLHQQLDPSSYRTLQPQASQIHNGQPHLGHHSLASQAGLDHLSALEDNSAVFHQNLQLQGPNDHNYPPSNPFDRSHGHRSMQIQSHGSPHTPQQHGGQFGMLTANPISHNSISRLQQEDDIFGPPVGADQKSNGHLSTKIVTDPPNLEEWRQKLFDVNETITLSEEQ